MKRSTKCIAQTINLSNPKTCVRPAQLQKLVSSEVMEPCPTPGHGSSSYSNPKPVSVRVCTRRELLERTCAPKLCDCPQKSSSSTSGHGIGRWIKFLFKSAIAAGFVYWTSSEGLWGDGRDTEDLYYRMVETVAPVLPEVPDLDNLKLPHMDNWRYRIYDGYNRAVLGIMGLLVGVPLIIQEKVYDVLFPCDPSEDPDTTVDKKRARRSEKEK